MQEINIKKTQTTPSVVFYAENKTLVIEGRLIPENAETLFLPINNWIEGYFLEENSELKVVFRLNYYNTSSSKRIVNLLKKLDLYFSKGKKIEATWEYEEDDDDCLNDGEDYKKIVSFPLTLVESEM